MPASGSKVIGFKTVKGTKRGVVVTAHARERIRQRKISRNSLLESVLSIENEKLESLNNSQERLVVFNTVEKFSFIISLHEIYLTVITVINGCEIENLRGSFYYIRS